MGVAITLFLDEIQLVPGWETFARRILDSEKVRLFVSGSSATMLSREVHTSMRGRAMEVTVFPFSFRESLLHRDLLPEAYPRTLLILLDPLPFGTTVPDSVEVILAIPWFLDTPEG